MCISLSSLNRTSCLNYFLHLLTYYKFYSGIKRVFIHKSLHLRTTVGVWQNLMKCVCWVKMFTGIECVIVENKVAAAVSRSDKAASSSKGWNVVFNGTNNCVGRCRGVSFGKQTNKQTDMCCHAFVLSSLAAGSVRYMHKASSFHHQRLLSNVESRYCFS